MNFKELRARGTIRRLAKDWSGVKHAIELYPKIENEMVELLVQGEMSDQAIINTILDCVLEESLRATLQQREVSDRDWNGY